MSTDELKTSSPDARVAEVLGQLRAGVRQRHAVLATQSESARSFLVIMEEVKTSQVLVPPVPTTHRGWLGAPIVIMKKAVYRLFTAWYLRPLIAQQNRFNQAVSRAVQELAARNIELAQELERARAPRH